MIRVLAIAALVFALAGCGKGDKDKSAKKSPPPGATHPTRPNRPPEPPLVAPEIQDEDLPVPSDYEAEIEGEITEKNYKDQLAGLQKEIEAPGPTE